MPEQGPPFAPASDLIISEGTPLDAKERSKGINRWLVGSFVLVHLLLLGWSIQSAPPEWTLLYWFAPYHQVLIDAGGMHLESLFEHFELWRLLSCAFIHGPWFHLLFNCVAMISIGRLGEELWGSRNHLLLFLGSAIGGSLLSMAVVESPLTVGASGGIFGLGVALILELRSRQSAQPGLAKISSSLTRQIGGWLLIGLGASIWTELPISAYGHLGGAISGALIWGLLRAPSRRWLFASALLLWTGVQCTGWKGQWRPAKYQVALAMDAATRDDCLRSAALLQPWLAEYQEDAVVLNTWAYCEASSGGDLQAALASGRKALALEPEDLNIMDTVGWTLCLMGAYDEGQALTKRAAELSDGDEVLVRHAMECRPATENSQ